MAQECVLDTMVLRNANAPLLTPPRLRSVFVRRLRLLQRIHSREITVLISRQVLAEYQKHIKSPLNDYVRAFFELISTPGHVIWNWAKWSGGQRDKARRCRYPEEDDHVLRTAIRPGGSTIFSEEQRMLKTNACIYRHFKAHIVCP